jgi:5-methyltetrahydrofolate--homocysteine methyltransferase
MREGHEQRNKEKDYLSIQEARQNKFNIDWTTFEPDKPKLVGTQVFNNYPLAEIAEFIDWTPFLQTWEIGGRYHNVLNEPQRGEQARLLLDDARQMLNEIIKINP